MRSRVADPVAFAPIVLADDGVIVEAGNRHEDHVNHLVVGLAESEGNHTSTALTLEMPVTRVDEANLVEEFAAEFPWADSTIELAFEPFGIKPLGREFACARPKSGNGPKAGMHRRMHTETAGYTRDRRRALSIRFRDPIPLSVHEPNEPPKQFGRLIRIDVRPVMVIYPI